MGLSICFQVEGGSPRMTLVASVVAVFVAPVIPRQVSLCSLLSSAPLVLFLTLGQYIVVAMGLTTTMYAQYNTFSFRVYPEVFLQVHEAL